MAVTEHYVGKEVLRKEDPELLTGEAKYTDDLIMPGMLWMHVVRSPYAHATIKRVDLTKARAMPGVVAAFSGYDLAEDWVGPLLMAWPVTKDINNPPHWPLTKDKVRHQGDGVAVIVAETRAQGADAAESVDVEYDPLPPVMEMEAALADESSLVHDEFGTNKCYTWTLTNGDVEKVFAEAPVVVKQRYVIQRQIPTAIETRSVLAQPSPAQGNFTLWTSSQIPHIVKVAMTLGLGIPESKLRVIAPAVGGGFGSKLQVYAEEMLSLALAKRLGRAIKWTETRTENYLATHHGRDQIQEMELAADEDGRIRGYRARILVNMGAYLMIITPGTPLLGAFVYCGPYGGEAYRVEFTGVFTNTVPTDAYRGAGRPEATYAIERTIDALARRIGKDPVEIRRLNFLPPFTEPTASPGGLMLDSGDYLETLERALELIGYEDLRKEQQIRREQAETKQIGIGFSTYLEMCGLAPSRVLGKTLHYAAGGWDAASIRVSPTGKVVIAAGTTPHGQSHATTFAQIAADDLGIPVDDIEVVFGDTELSPLGMDTYGSRSVSVGGVAVHRAAQKVVEKSRKIAAHELEVSEDDLDYEGGTFSVKGAPDRAKTIPDLAFAAWTAHNLPDGLEPNLGATAAYDPQNFVFPYGAHICAVEVDTETGRVDVMKYAAVDDVGRIINPQIVDGQVVGGVIQGIAEALFEEAVYDEGGNLVTGSLTNYLVPAASDVPSITIGRSETPSTTNELGVKGVGETGTIASPVAVINAVIDALSHLGITDIERPATPERVWRAIRQARGGAR